MLYVLLNLLISWSSEMIRNNIYFYPPPPPRKPQNVLRGSGSVDIQQSQAWGAAISAVAMDSINKINRVVTVSKLSNYRLISML